MNINALQAVIEQALLNEAVTGQLHQQIKAQLPILHRCIRLPNDDAEKTLLRFASSYIEFVPDLLKAVLTAACEAKIDEHIKPLLKVAEGFFLQPPQLLDGHAGLAALLDEAYFAHRLIEEINDRYIQHLGATLIPTETTVANLIAQQLIGEEFAYQLDQYVEQALEQLLGPESFNQSSVRAYRQQLLHGKTHAAWQRWPCLASQLGIELQLTPSEQRNQSAK